MIFSKLKKIFFEKKCCLWKENRVYFGDRLLNRLFKNTSLGELEAKKTAKLLGGKNTKVGKWSYIGGNSKVRTWTSEDRVTIGKFCSIADNVIIMAGGEHAHKTRLMNYPIMEKFMKIAPKPNISSKGPIIIGNDVWIGSHAIILSGVNIGDGAVIGAAALVSKNVPPYCIAVGNPVKVIGQRFNDDIIEKLLKIRWWDWDDEKIIISLHDFYGDINSFVKKYYTA